MRENPEICVLNCLIMNNGDTDEPHNPGIDVIPYCVHKIIPEEGGVFLDYLTALLSEIKIYKILKNISLSTPPIFFFFLSQISM